MSNSNSFCPSCGAEIKIGDTQCDYCGSEFTSKVTKGKIDLKSRACPFCSFKADLNEEYCPNCGDNLKFNCPHCHTIKFIITKFCKQCGKDISELSHCFINKDYAGIANLSESIAGDNIDSRLEILKEAFNLKSFSVENKNTHEFLLKYAQALNQKYIRLLRSSSQSLLGSTYAEKEKIIKLILSSKATQSIKDEAQTLLIQRGKEKESSSGCFIATATMGDYNHPYVIELRHFRDQVLQQHVVGRRSIKIYYRYSPFFAQIISKSQFLKKITYHLIVSPLYKFSKNILNKNN